MRSRCHEPGSVRGGMCDAGSKGVATKFCLGGRIHRHPTHLPPKFSFSSDFGHYIKKNVTKCIIFTHTSMSSSGVATGGGGASGATSPQPPIRHPVRSMQIRGDFHVGKNGGRFTVFAPTFYMHRRYGGCRTCRYDSTQLTQTDTMQLGMTRSRYRRRNGGGVGISVLACAPQA